MAVPTQQAVLSRPYVHGEVPEPDSSELLAKQYARESNAKVYPRPGGSFAPGLLKKYWRRRLGRRRLSAPAIVWPARDSSSAAPPARWSAARWAGWPGMTRLSSPRWLSRPTSASVTSTPSTKPTGCSIFTATTCSPYLRSGGSHRRVWGQPDGSDRCRRLILLSVREARGHRRCSR